MWCRGLYVVGVGAKVIGVGSGRVFMCVEGWSKVGVGWVHVCSDEAGVARNTMRSGLRHKEYLHKETPSSSIIISVLSLFWCCCNELHHHHY